MGGGVLFSPLCGQLPQRGSQGGRLSVCLKFFSNVNVAAPSSVNFVDSFPKEEAKEIRVHVFADFCAAKTRQGEGLMEERYNRKQVAPLIRPKLCFVHLPPKGKACNKASNFVDREATNNRLKLKRPLIFQKFLPEYSENQKCAAHNMLRPSFVAVRRHFPPPKGKA